MDEPIIPPTEDIEEKPPLFKKWQTWYTLVASELILLIIIFYIFTKAFE